MSARSALERTARFKIFVIRPGRMKAHCSLRKQAFFWRQPASHPVENVYAAFIYAHHHLAFVYTHSLLVRRFHFSFASHFDRALVFGRGVVGCTGPPRPDFRVNGNFVARTHHASPNKPCGYATQQGGVHTSHGEVYLFSGLSNTTDRPVLLVLSLTIARYSKTTSVGARGHTTGALFD